MSRRRQLAILAAGAVIGAVGGLVVLIIMFTGPRMHDQPNLRTFHAAMPLPPEGSVPLHPRGSDLPTAAAAPALANPLPATAANLAAGRTYYQYYCVFCHGEPGGPTGPVGESFVPTPTRLTRELVGKMSGGELVRAMLTGTGHDPVLPRVVYPEYRWPLELYVRTTAPKAGP